MTDKSTAKTVLEENWFQIQQNSDKTKKRRYRGTIFSHFCAVLCWRFIWYII